MHKSNSRNEQFRLRPKQAYSSDDARRWAFYGYYLYSHKDEFDRYRKGKLIEVKKELDSIGELDANLPWLLKYFLPWLDPEWRPKLNQEFFLSESLKSEEAKKR